MADDRIVVRGDREHNPKSIDVEIPRDQFAGARASTADGHAGGVPLNESS